MNPASAELVAKIRHVREEAASARLTSGRRFAVTTEVVPGVRLVLLDVGGTAVVFSLWDRREDVVALCGDDRVPAITTLLAVDDAALRSVVGTGHGLDISGLSPSKDLPDLHYVLIHYASRRHIHRTIQRLLQASEPTAAAA